MADFNDTDVIYGDDAGAPATQKFQTWADHMLQTIANLPVLTIQDTPTAGGTNEVPSSTWAANFLGGGGGYDGADAPYRDTAGSPGMWRLTTAGVLYVYQTDHWETSNITLTDDLGDEPAEATYTLEDSQTSVASNIGSGSFAGTQYVSLAFVSGATYTPTKFDLPMWLQGSPTDNFTVQLREHDGTNPSTEVLAESDLIDSASIGSSASPGVDVEILLTDCPEITSGTWYCFVAFREGGLDGSNYVRLGHNFAEPTLTQKDADGAGTWAEATNPATAAYKGYSSP